MRINEEKLQSIVKKVVKEALEYENAEFERIKTSQGAKHGEKNKNASKNKRTIVLKWLKDPSVNCAEIMRQLWRPAESEEDAARSYFYKCRDGKLNDSGEPYKFTDEDINSLYSLKSGNL